MKKFDPVTVIGSLVCVVALALIFAHNWIQARNAPAPAAPAVPVVSTEAAPSAAPVVPVAPGEVASLPAVETPGEPVTLALEGRMTVEADSHGGGVRSVTLPEFRLQTRDPAQTEPLVIGQNSVPFLALSLGGTSLRTVATTSENNSLATTRVSGDSVWSLEESWTLGDSEQDPYTIRYTLRVTNTSRESRTLSHVALSCGALPDFLAKGEGNTSFSKYLSGCVAYGRVGKNDAKTLDMKKISAEKMTAEKRAQYENTPANWVGVASKYFLFALHNLSVDGQPATFRGFSPRQPAELLPQQFYSADALLPELSLAPGESATITLSGYAGPKSLQNLEPIGQGLPSILNMDLFFFWHFDWMGWLCRVLLWGLNGIAGWFPPSCAYGMAIILITLLVKLVFMPLAWHSTRNMKRMSALQPQLKVLREKYKEDPQRMYYEQQKLFKENNVSQTGGCLPMLVQIPVFFAMFNTFRGAIEIRNASFLWVADLSMPDPIFGLPIHPLAILTGATMFLQQKLQPMPDPSQARMMNIMSLVFIVFFYNMPAGLTLYMTVNQLTSIVQMLLFRRMEKKAGATPVPPRTKAA
ncbi:MAG: YidC/Oxa1 family insertase periplasmic-domain containing protein [Oligosphaeraceae bacterium]